MGVSRGCPIFGYPLLSQERTSNFAGTFIGRSEQKPMKNFGNSSRGRSQGVPKIFRAPTYRAHCAVIFAITQFSHESWLYISKLHGFARFPGDSTALVMFFTTKPAGRAARVKPSLHKPRWAVFGRLQCVALRVRNGSRHVIEECSKLNPENASHRMNPATVTYAKFSCNLNPASRTKKIHRGLGV